MTHGALVAMLLGLAGCGGTAAAPGELGGADVAALHAWGAATPATLAPWRCGALDREGAPVVAPHGWLLDGAVLRRDTTTSPAPVTLAFVGDADAAGPPATFGDVVRALDTTRPDVVISLGGLGDDAASIEAALAALAAPTRLLVALPGAREPAAAHAAAVAAAAAAGAAVVDGSRVRIVQLGDVVLGTLPGLPWPARLAAGVEGCGHDLGDVAALRARMHDVGGRAVLASVRAPERSLRAGGLAGVDAGDHALTAALTRVAPTLADVELVVHPQLTAAPTPGGESRRAAGDAPIVLAAPHSAQ